MPDLTLKKNNTVERCDDVIQEEIDGELVMMNLISGDYFGLDKIASRVWEIIDPPKTVAEIIEQLLIEFDVKQDQCEKDLYSLLERFSDYKIINITT